MALDTVEGAFAVDVALLRPTQFDAGMAVVRTLMNKIQNLASEGEATLDAYVREWVVPVVIGPSNDMYMVDRHSECVAMYWSELINRKVYVRMVANWSHMEETDFWQKMKGKGLCYLKKGKQEVTLASELPQALQDMSDDPYRSLAWACRTNDPPGFTKTQEGFTEFVWSDFLRGYEEVLNEKSNGKWLEFLEKTKKRDESVQYYIVPDSVLSAAVALCRQTRASSLPGFISEALPSNL